MLREDWDLGVVEHRRRAVLRPQKDRAPPELVHKILFSMPPGAPSKEILAAVKNFAREEFGLKHRNAVVLHTDEPHPHVCMVVKAVSEHGERLNIRKATLRDGEQTSPRNGERWELQQMRRSAPFVVRTAFIRRIRFLLGYTQ